MNQEEIRNLNSPIMRNGIKVAIKDFPKKKNAVPNRFTAELY
jgi:hypothetical protein